MKRHSLALAVVVATASASAAYGQAWLPLRGEGSISLSYTYFDGNDHLFSTDRIDGQSTRGYVAEGTHWFLGDTYSHNFLFSLEYGLLARLAVSGSIGFVRAKYEGRSPVNLEIDDGLWHGGFQDFGLDLRGVLLRKPLVVTPFVGYGLPTNAYPSGGHSAIGRGLQEFRFGVYLGWSLTPVLPNAYLHGSYAYGITEEFDNTQIRRAVMSLEAGYYLTRRLPIRAMGSYEDTYGGHDWVSSDPSQPIEHGSGSVTLDIQSSAARYARIGFGSSFALTNDLGVYANYVTTVWGENLDDADFIVAGVGWAFKGPF